eukprot:CAMPEP_0174953870 /NCGR_PEP_ID=MMETSP0004_2-20121128/103_1 /TAXON_ID=420556 /ORGANISM="Ochromonas sp., Strain CCMP1393" /LENGTH=297 /DNA_ID=CAMNT_0016201609 /DNA_START=27 /DNA_END=920 /DNA_ORIENTATION=+
MTSPIGFVGIGIMGKGMLKNLATKLDASFVVWNRSPEICEEMKTMFPSKISIATSAADVVKQCDVTYTMLSTMDASKAVFDAPDVGVISGVSAGKIIVDCATLSPERMIEENAAISAKGGKFLEAPVSGSKGPADTGTLIFLCGGDEELFASQATALDAMGKAKYLFGPVGQGTNVKLVVNMIMGTMMGAFAEGLTLAQAADIPTDTLLQVLDQGAMSNPMFRLKGTNMCADNHPTNFPLKHAQKDMDLALTFAAQKGVTLPTTEAANACMLKAMDPAGANAGDDDFSAVMKAYQKK